MSRRIRKHANPFNVQTRLGLIDRMELFGREAPLEVEFGCGSAGYLFERAKNHPERDFIGLEVRKPLVNQGMKRREHLGLENVVLLYANANENVALAEPGIIQCFHVHFPDPCFKKKHWKRRIVQPSTVRGMTTALGMGGLVYVQTDVKPLAEEMYFFLEHDGALESRLDPGMLVDRPFPETTEWERHHQNVKEPIYRMLFEKVREPAGPVPELELRDTNPRRADPDAAAEPGNS